MWCVGGGSRGRDSKEESVVDVVIVGDGVDACAVLEVEREGPIEHRLRRCRDGGAREGRRGRGRGGGGVDDNGIRGVTGNIYLCVRVRLIRGTGGGKNAGWKEKRVPAQSLDLW